MIAFGVAVTSSEIFESIALPGIHRVAEPDTRILTRVGYDSIQRPYNEMLEEAAALPGLEALILLHQDLELVDDSLLPRVRASFQDPAVGVIGALGWRGADPYRWSGPGGGSNRSAPLGVRMLTFWGRASAGSGRFGQGCSERPQEVEMVDGVLMALAPWVVRSIRFDERLAKRFHCYDIDFGLRVRSAGGRLVCDPIPHVHHMSRLWRDREEFVQSRVEFARRWDPDVRPPEWGPAFHS